MYLGQVAVTFRVSWTLLSTIWSRRWTRYRKSNATPYELRCLKSEPAIVYSLAPSNLSLYDCVLLIYVVIIGVRDIVDIFGHFTPPRYGMRCIAINRSVCASVCLSATIIISGTTGPIGTKFCAQISCGRGSVLFWRRCATLCTSGFVDDVTFGRKGREAARIDSTQRRRSITCATGAKSDVYECLSKMHFLAWLCSG